MPRVGSAATPTASSPATGAGTASATSPTSTAAVAAPTSAPTTGAQRSAAAAVRASGALARTGRTVSHEKASASPLTSPVSRDRGGLGEQPRRHLQQRDDGRPAG